MDLHPFLECDASPSPALWYVVSSPGDRSPSMRVGHTISQVGSKIYVIGGANPSGSFADVFVLDLQTLSWKTVDIPVGVLKARYEHSAFVPTSRPEKIYIFGGADPTGSRNDVQVFDTATETWSNVVTTGTPPSPRTYHNGACIGDSFVVYSGGQNGTDPVGDRQTYTFDAVTHTWATLNFLQGDTPKPRLGHLMLAVGNKMFLHGGMSGATFYDDLHVLDLSRGTCGAWVSVRQKKGQPSARAGHGGFVSRTDLFVFGGMSRDGALDDLYKLDTETLKWSRVILEGPSPASRLDFAACTAQLKILSTARTESDVDLAAQGRQAKEILEERLRLDSAGSGRSAGSAHSIRSVEGANSYRSPSKTSGSGAECSTGASRMDGPASVSLTEFEDRIVDCTADLLENCQLSEERLLPVREARSTVCLDEEYKTFQVAMILGGMDTEGEIFEDCLVMLLREL